MNRWSCFYFVKKCQKISFRTFSKQKAIFLTNFLLSVFLGSSDWVLVNNNVRPSDLVQNGIRFQKFVVLDLIPRTKYILRITAHNSAGSTVKQFTFTTLNSDGTPKASEGQKKDDSEMVLPFILVAFTVTSIVLGIALMLCIKKLEVKQNEEVEKDEVFEPVAVFKMPSPPKETPMRERVRPRTRIPKSPTSSLGNSFLAGLA